MTAVDLADRRLAEVGLLIASAKDCLAPGPGA